MRIIASTAFALTLVFSATACGGSWTTKDRVISPVNSLNEDSQYFPEEESQNSMNEPADADDIRVRLRFDDEEITVKMYDNPTSRALLDRLPLTLTFKDYNGIEKMSILEKGLTTEASPEGSTPRAGDISYYAPWKDIAIFYEHGAYSLGLIPLGRVESDLDELKLNLSNKNEDFSLTIDKDATN